MMLRAVAYTPLAKISGMTPRMKAKAVMMIGRTRSLAAPIAASMSEAPCSLKSLSAYSTTRMAFLAASPISITSEICMYISLT